MNDVSTTMAKLAGTRKAVSAALSEEVNRGRGPGHVRHSFDPAAVGHYFKHAEEQLDGLRQLLPALYEDFQKFPTDPQLEMGSPDPNKKVYHYSRGELGRLGRDIDQIFEIRANSELAQPAASAYVKVQNRVFITHGRSGDWREVQAYIEKDIKLDTLELAQEPSLGRTIIEKLEANAERCDSAVMVMTGDDIDADGQTRARENVMHEIGYFQSEYGRSRVVLLHEEGVSIPTNLSGVVYIPFPKGAVSAAFGVLVRELTAMYKR